MQRADLEVLGQLDYATRARDVDLLVLLLVGGHVVEGGQMDQVVDPAA